MPAFMIPEGLNKQLTDFDSPDEITLGDSIPRSPSLASSPLTDKFTQRLPTNFPAELTQEECHACWKQARKDLPAGDKHAVQRRALELISEFSHTKAASEAKQKTVESRQRPRVRRRPAAAEEIPVAKKAKPRTAATQKRESPVPKKRKVIRVVRKTPAEPEPKTVSPKRTRQRPKPVQEVVTNDPCAEVVLEFDSVEYVSFPLRVIDSPEFVVCMLDPADKESLMHVDGAQPGTDAKLSIYWYDDTGVSNRRVLCHPYRFRDGDTVYLMFIVLPDGV